MPPQPQPTPNAPSTWLTLRDFCEELRVPVSTAYKWCAAGSDSGRFPRFCRLPNGSIRIRREWLDQWLERRAQRR